MSLLDERSRSQIQQRLTELVNPVKLAYFTQELECPTCRETGELLKETAELSDKIHRSWGILREAKLLGVDEFLNLSSARESKAPQVWHRCRNQNQ
jgi:protein-arginine kinase